MIGVHINYFLLKARTNYVLVTEPVVGVAHVAGPATLDPTRGCTVPAARTEKQTRNYFLHPMVIFFMSNSSKYKLVSDGWVMVG